MEHVISFDPPYAAEDVVHRAGRTARCSDIARVQQQQAFCQPIFPRFFAHKSGFRGPSKTGTSGSGRSGRVTWIGTSRVLQSIRQVIEGDASSLTRTSSNGENENGARRTTRSMSSAQGGFGRHSYSLSNEKSARRTSGRDLKQSGFGERDKMLSGMRRSEGRDSFRTGRTADRSRTASGDVSIGAGGGWKGSGQKVHETPRARGSGSFGGEGVSSLSSSKGRVVNSQRWGSIVRRQSTPAPQSRMRGAGGNDASSNGWSVGARKGSFSKRGVNDSGPRMAAQSDRSRDARSGWPGRSAGVASVAGTISSKKHKMRRPVMTYDRIGRR